MAKRLLASFLLLTLCVVAPLQAKTIIWVTESQDQDNDGTNDSKVWADKLTAAGYTVDFQPAHWNALTAALQADLNKADLVIMSCTTQSGTFSTTTLNPLWNGVTAPMMLCSPYIARSTRWQWINNGDGTLPNNNGDQGTPLMQVVKTDHPIFFGVALDPSNQLKALDPTLGSGHASFLATNDPGNGILIAKTVPTDLVKDWSWIIEWPKGTKFYANSAYTATNTRMYFTGIGFHEVSGSKPMRGYSLTDEGWKVFLNAVKYLMGEPLGTALSPSPADGKTDVLPATGMTWKPGVEGQVTHDVYFGTALDAVTAASRQVPGTVLVSLAQDANSYVPVQRLAYGTTYYWRVDEVLPSGAVRKGTVWSFTTEAIGYTLSKTNITATASASAAGFSPQSTVDESGLTGDLHGIDSKTMWSTDKNPAQPVWLRYDFDKAYKLYQLLVWNANTENESELNYGLQNVTIEYTGDGTNWTKLGDYVFAPAPAAANYKYNTVIDCGGIVAKSVKITAQDTYGGAKYSLSEVRFLYIPVWAREPKPDVNSSGIDPRGLNFTWRSGREAVSHEVYVGTDPAALALDGTTSTNAYTPAGLNLGTKYYWRVDEVNSAATPKSWTGDVWYFTTPDFLSVDNFEKYNNADGTAVFNVWQDGYGKSDNGAQIGYDLPGPFMETTLRHSGAQSAPFKYGQQGLATSEVTLPFTPPQDWSGAGIKTLTFWFYGYAANGPITQLYVKINDTKIAYSGNVANAQRERWNPCNFDLSTVAGATLKSVGKLTIGVANGASKGTLLLDDIRLYRVAPEVQAPVDPGTQALVSYFNMEGGKVVDTISGVNGTLTDVTFAASTGAFGQAAQFNGTSSFVDLGADYWTKVLSKLSSSTFAVWVNYTGDNLWARALALGTGVNANVLMIPSAATAGIVRFQVKSNVPNDGLPATGYVTGYIESPMPISIGWHHLVGVVDAAPAGLTYPVLYLYVDGVRVAGPVAGKLPKDIDVVPGTPPQMWLGKSHNSPDPFFNGALDEFRVYNRALSAGEIAYLSGDR